MKRIPVPISIIQASAGVKLDLTFLSLEQLRKHTREEMERAERIPIIAKSIILFGDTPVP
ncbi:hypothetical protein KTH_49040 [Thermosporothrix hazakensis]|nr:hypothetical protein KTH_49040 [Thermosporothrix hazakensis]